MGDTCRVQDGITLDIVAEWRWTGSSWERMQVDNQQISNLDVGKLTAGSASINEIAARKIASDVGRFLELTTDQLTVTGNASFTDVVARNIWTRIITAQQGEFEEIKAGMIAANSITSDHIQVGALDGQVISGATIQTSKAPDRGIKITDDGMDVYASDGWKSLSIDAWTGRVRSTAESVAETPGRRFILRTSSPERPRLTVTKAPSSDAAYLSSPWKTAGGLPPWHSRRRRTVTRPS